jgi:hypothetical protein
MKTRKTFSIIGLIIAISFVVGCATEKKVVLEKFKAEESKVLVCPVHILVNDICSYDTVLSDKIVEYLNTEKYADASFTPLLPIPNNEWRINEAKMLSVSINYCIEFVCENIIPDDTYVLYVEILKSGQDTEIHAVHYCLINNLGEIAMRGLINSKWEEFQDVNPKTNEDCIEVFINGFEGKMEE